MTERISCANCDSSLIQFLDVGSSPIADILPTTPNAALKRYPLKLLLCDKCWLVQLSEVVPDEEVYNSGYAYYTGVSKADYHRELAQRLLRDFNPKFIIEIGSNDGDLLQHFMGEGRKTLGVDPASGPADVATERGIETLVKSFGVRVAEDIYSAHGHADLVIANHVAAHISDLHDFFGGIAKVLDPGHGVASLEVQYVEDLLTGNQFDNVYHQHRFFYSLTSLNAVAEAHGMRVIRARWVDVQGGSQHVIIAHKQVLYSPQFTIGSETWLQSRAAYDGLQGRVMRVRDRLLNLLQAEKDAGHSVVGYGASAKSTTLLNYCGIDKHLLQAVEDTTPYKIGRYMPGTSIPVIQAIGAKKPDTYLLTVWNYLPKALKNERQFFADGGHMIVPIPLPVLL